MVVGDHPAFLDFLAFDELVEVFLVRRLVAEAERIIPVVEAQLQRGLPREVVR